MNKKLLCKCNNCDFILLDENPQVGAIAKETNGTELNMIQIFDENGLFLYWGCPKCETDNYLTDI